MAKLSELQSDLDAGKMAVLADGTPELVTRAHRNDPTNPNDPFYLATINGKPIIEMSFPAMLKRVHDALGFSNLTEEVDKDIWITRDPPKPVSS